VKSYVDEYYREPEVALVVGERTIGDGPPPWTVLRATFPAASFGSRCNWKEAKAALKAELDRMQAEEGIEAEPFRG
jgi:hypothetical protein